MISYLSGKVIFSEKRFIILETKSGIGFKIYVNNIENKYQIQKEISIFTYLSVQEDSLNLYGFDTLKELETFETLIGISGIGPKTAMAVLGLTSVEVLEEAIASESVPYLVSIAGIGKKTAEKIIFELKDKIKKKEEINLQEDLDALEALKALGYNQEKARKALQKINKQSKTTSEKVKEAIKILSQE